MLYLACLPTLDALTAQDRVQRAHDLCLAALLGDTIYNFGELLLHPILTSLALDGDQPPPSVVTGTAAAEEESRRWGWLRKLVVSFAQGDLGGFEALQPRFSEEVRTSSPSSLGTDPDLRLFLPDSRSSKPRSGSWSKRSG